MITVMKDDESYFIDSLIRLPGIYLDHWAIREFSSDPSHCRRFLHCLKTKGTLLFSWANALEITGNTGASAHNIQRFLAGIGEQWFPLEMNPSAIIERERTRGKCSPCFGSGFLKAYYPYIHDGPLSLSLVVDLMHDIEVKAAAQAHIESIKEVICTEFERLRKAEHVPRKIPPFDPNHPAEFSYNGLRQLVAKQSFTIVGNHALDFCHATVSLAYGNMVLLDELWKELARQLGMPASHIQVYSKPQIDQFLRDLEQFDSAAA